MSIDDAINRLQHLVEIVPDKLDAVNNAVFSAKPDPGKWSKKEILGHLIDSAANNHQRFVRIQYETSSVVFYDQNNWVEHSGYRNYETAQLILFWTAYNKHLLHIGKQFAPDSLSRTGIGLDGQPHSLAYYFCDYVAHLEHHLHQIIEY